jgi:hypothetical protein
MAVAAPAIAIFPSSLAEMQMILASVGLSFCQSHFQICQ